MNKKELITAIAAHTGESQKVVAAVLDGFQDVVGDTLANNESVILMGFGSFVPKQRAARTGRNPQTGELMELAAVRVATFKAGAILRDKVR